MNDDPDRISCLECGRSFVFLPTHLRLAHGMNARQYRERWEIPAGRPLAGAAYRELHRAKLARIDADGILQRDLVAAIEASRGVSRRKTPTQAVEHAAMIKALRPGDHSLLPPGSKRADGRDADRAREYQREYRLRKMTP